MEEFHLWNSSRNLFGLSPCSSAVNGSFGWSNHKPATAVQDAQKPAHNWNLEDYSYIHSDSCSMNSNIQIDPNSFPLMLDEMINSTELILPSFDHFMYNTPLLNAPFHTSFSEANAKHHNEKFGNEESAIKRPRVETPSPLPAFKVRKEKLGDRVTALQQLVSPFGKTDTASVLHEAIEYIKLLHDQVSVLCSPYLKNGSSPLLCQKGVDNIKDEGEEEAMKDLRSRGLCLVPIASTFPVAAETSPEFWTPTFGARFR